MPDAAKPDADSQDAPPPEITADVPLPRPHVPAPDRDVSEAAHIGPYRIIEKVGEGGMGIVYRAEQRAPVRRIVALKVIKLGMDTREVIARFEAERQALALLSHPNVAKVLDAGMTETGRPYFAMEHVPGVPLTQYCDDNKLTTRQRLELFIPVCHAVQHAHQKGIIHRDLKPSNILVTMFDGNPVPKVIDFGIAKAVDHRLAQHTLYTQTGAMVGTPEYMSPEQAMTSGLDVDTRTDVYSLGVILYELLTGTLPFDPATLRGAGMEAMARIIRESEPAKPSTRVQAALPHGQATTAARHRTDPRTLRRELSGDLDWITLKAMEKDRTRRYETANGLAMDVQRHLRDEPVLARPPSTMYRLDKFVRKHRVGVTASAAVLAAMIAGIVGTTVGMLRARQARDDTGVALRAAEKARDEANEAIRFIREVALINNDPTRDAAPVEQATRRLDAGWLKDQPDVVASCRTAFGWWFEQAERLDDAERQFVKALESSRREDGTYPAYAALTQYSLGWVYQQRGALAEAERYYRESVATCERHRDATLLQSAWTLQRLAEIRENLGDRVAARGFRLRAVEARVEHATRQSREFPDNAQIHWTRADTLMQLGRFRQALPDAVRATTLAPDNSHGWFVRATLHLHAGDEEGYREACRQMLIRFSDSRHNYDRERAAKACLIAPRHAGDIGALSDLIDHALKSPGPQPLMPYFQLSKGMLEYRAGRYASAIEWLGRSTSFTRVSDLGVRDLFAAMANYRLGQVNEARKLYQAAVERRDGRLPQPGEDLIFDDAYALLECIRREAESLLATGSRADGSGTGD